MDGPDTHGLTGESSAPDREDTNKRHGGQRYHFHRTRQRRMGVEVHMRSEMEGLDPIEDGIVIQLYELCRHAKENNITLRGHVNVSCEISDYDGIGMIISRNSYHRRKRL